jgi:hypothetical protein
MFAAASLTFCTAGSKSPIKIAMIATTTKSSISVNALRFDDVGMFVFVPTDRIPELFGVLKL